MNKNNVKILSLVILIALLFGVEGYIIGRGTNKNVVPPKMDEQIKNEEKPIELKEDNSEEEKEENTGENNEESVIVEPKVNRKNQVKLNSVTSKECKDMITKLNFTKNNFFCYADECSINVNDIISYFKSDIESFIEFFDIKDYTDSSDLTIGGDIYNLSLSNGKIKVIKNGETKDKYYINNISNVKSFRVTFSVQSGNLLFVLDNKNNVYAYDVSDDWKKVSNKSLVYKNVKDFDIFEGSNYEKCANRSEGQDITIALHTNLGKTLYGSPF